ncbi:myb-like protein X [Nylanderia fulva]|uniref:myb-like protein X n=1 Tax=Nylanderia fulva TaxID=613905 RepID=UPI0010FB0CC1|nr:myb-like protein X [Nylanderia fulva]
MLSSSSPIDRPSLHPGTRYFIAPRVPHGLAAVVEGLTREVLRHHPEDIYVFAAHHFEKLLKLRDQYHAEVYSGREFDHEFGGEFKLWPTKQVKDVGRSSNSDGSLEKKIELFERREKMSTDVEESTDISTDRENRKTSKQTCSRGLSTTKRTSKKSKDNDATSDVRATRIISQMSSLHGPSKHIQTKDIKQELRKNKLSGEKGKTVDTEKGMRNERRSRMKVSKTEKDPEEEIERTTTTTTSSSRTSARRPLRKVRRIESESETETEREMTARVGRENGSSVKNNGASSETLSRTGSKEKRPEAWLSEHSSERKVSSRALSMDRIRAYVLRKFASTASLEVLRSPTYVEQVQEVIDRAVPIIKEKLEEVKVPRGKRSRSVDLVWNRESFRQHTRDEKKYRDEEEGGRKTTGNKLPERKVDTDRKEEKESSLERDETEEKKLRRRSAGSGKKSRRRENGCRNDVEMIDQVDSKHSDKLEHEYGTRDTLEAKLIATQNILEDISRSASDLGGVRKNDSAGGEPPEPEVSDHANIVSLPVVRPPSSRNSRSATRNGSDSLTLPPISPEAPKSTKKKDELSLPVLPVSNGNNSAGKSQDDEEASTLRDITNDIEDIAILPEDDHEKVIVDAEKHEIDKNMDDVARENIPEQFIAEKRGSLEEFEELERRKTAEIFNDSLNITPEVADVPRPDSLESDEEKRVENDDADLANTFDELKDKLIEIEMVERNIEMALASQQFAMDGGEATSQAEKSMIDGKINDVGKSTNEVEETVNEVEESTEKISMNKDDGKKKNDEEEKNSTNKIEQGKDVIETSTNQKKNLSHINETEISKNKAEEKIERSSNETTSQEETSVNEIKKSTNKINEAEVLKNGDTTSHVKILTKAAEEAVQVPEDETSTDKKSTDERSISKKLSTDVEELTKAAEEAVQVPEDETSTDKKSTDERSISKKLSTDVEELTVISHIEDVQFINPKSQNEDDQITRTAVYETDDDNAAVSKNKADNTANKSSNNTVCGNAASKGEISARNLPENTRTKARKKREIESPGMTSLSLELPISYVLSEGSPCEIPDSVTTVIIPDRPCPSPVTLEDENYQLESTNQKEESFIRSNIAKTSETLKKDRSEYGMEVFGEHVRPETTVLPVDIDFVRGAKGMKSNQDIIIAHQNLNKIKEEDEEKKDVEREEIKSPQEQKDDEEPVVHEQVIKLTTLENIVEREENEETGAKKTPESKDAEEVSSGAPEYESLPDTIELIDTGLTDEGNADITVESRGTMENSSEENESTQDTRTMTSSEVKESNRSIESPSLDRPVVPELNLDSLQDNTVSSFKMTANGTATKEDNGSPSDTTTSLIEPLISDDRLMNQSVLADREEDDVAEELTESLSRYMQSEVAEADQLYRAEQAEYERLEKDLSSPETNLEGEAKSQEDDIGLKALTEVVELVGPRGKEMEKELESEEEIARELIGSLEEDILYTKKLTLEEKSKDEGESEKSNLNVNDKSNRSLPDSVDEQEKGEISSDKIQMIDEAETEVIGELSSQVDNKPDHKDNNTDNETEELELKVENKAVEVGYVAPLAQFEQDELLELNDGQTIEKIEEKITVESKLDNIDNNQENQEDKQTSVEEVVESQSNESTNKIEELHKEQKENEEKSQDKDEECEQEKLQVEEKCEEEKSKVHESTNESTNKIEELHKEQKENEEKSQDKDEECEQEKLQVEEKCEEEKLKVHEEYQQEKSEEYTQEDLKIHEKDNYKNLQLEEKIVDIKTVPLEASESRKGSMNESTNDNDEREETERITSDEFVTNSRTERDVKNNEIEESENFSAKIENVHRPIASTISEQSMEDHSHGGYWITQTQSSTVETVIETSDSTTNTDEKIKSATDVPEIIKDESLNQKKDDFYSAVIKIQACVRGFLMRRRMKKDVNSKTVSDNVSSVQKINTIDHLTVPHPANLREVRSGRQRLRREEALRNTTLSLENAFATGRLQHTGEFHDSVPLPLFDLIYNNRADSTTSEELSNKTIEEEEQTSQSDIAKSNAESDSVHDDTHEGGFQKGNVFTDHHSTFPIVMHLLADASRNCHFAVSQNSRSDFNANDKGMKPAESTLDFLMLGYPRDDDNRYLNFITSVEDLEHGSNMDSLPLNDTIKCPKNVDDARPSTTSGEGSIREPLALPGTSQGVVIEEVTSLDAELTRSESATKPSTASKTSLDTNSSVPSEECTLEDEKNDLGTSPRIAGDRKRANGEAERQKSDSNLESIPENDSEDARKERVEEETGEKT